MAMEDPLPALAFRDICCEPKLVSNIMLWKTKRGMMCSFQENKGAEGGRVIEQAKIHRHHFVPTSFKIPEKDNHEPFEELFYDTSEFDFLSHDPKLWIVGRHFLSTDRWMWKVKLDTKLEQHEESERLVYNERTFEAKASLEDFVKETYPSLSCPLAAMRPYCVLRVNRYLKSSREWVDVCSWKHNDETFFYVVGTENAFPSTSLSLPLDLPPAPSKFMAVVSKSFPSLLSMFSSFEVELAQNSSLISDKFPTDLLPTWDSEDEYFYDKRGEETDESDW